MPHEQRLHRTHCFRQATSAPAISRSWVMRYSEFGRPCALRRQPQRRVKPSAHGVRAARGSNHGDMCEWHSCFFRRGKEQAGAARRDAKGGGARPYSAELKDRLMPGKIRVLLFDAGNTLIFPHVDQFARELSALGYKATPE